MAISGSMFLTELLVSELRSYVKCKDFLIKSQFADVFSFILKESRESEKTLPARKNRRKSKIKKNVKETTDKTAKVHSGYSVLFTDDIDNLITNMKTCPMELSLWTKTYPKYKIASTNVPWSMKFIEYLQNISMGIHGQPISMIGEYNVFDEVSSRRMAVIKLNIRMSYITDQIRAQLAALSEESTETFRNSDFDTKSLSTNVQQQQFNLSEETGIIKTLYSGGKKNVRKSNTKKNKELRSNKSFEEPNYNTEKETAEYQQMRKMSDVIEEVPKIKDLNSSIVSLVKSVTDIDKNKQIDLMKSKSCSSVNQDHLNILNYIFGNPSGTFGNQVYCVNYFTINEAKSNTSPSKSLSKNSTGTSNQSSPQSSTKDSVKFDSSENTSTKNNIKLHLCNDECSVKPNVSIGSIKLPQDVGVKSIDICKDVNCKHKKFRQLPPPPDDRILLELDSLKNKCCETIEKTENVVGKMKATMKVGADPCYCECRCQFGFTKKTRYCKTCGGYELVGEDVTKDPQLEFPCPVYYNLMDKPKIKPSITSDTKKASKAKSVAEKSIESEKEPKKGKKKRKDDKFKFNYGYTGIPPQIGHDYCAQPCTGTLGEVPKSMGWLWTADNVPGMKVAQGWKPGAITKSLLRKLNKAKKSTLPVQTVKIPRKAKKNVVDKPTLIVCKMNGEYHIEMQVSPENSDTNVDQCSPIKYTVKSEENENRIRKREMKRQRLIQKAIDKVWSDPYHPEVCERTCLKAYKQAVGLLPYDPNKPDCTCDSDEEVEESGSCSCEETDTSSDGSSLDLQWEIHFSPPSARC